MDLKELYDHKQELEEKLTKSIYELTENFKLKTGISIRYIDIDIFDVTTVEDVRLQTMVNSVVVSLELESNKRF